MCSQKFCKIHKINSCARVSFLIRACNFIKKETLTQVLSCEFCEISKNTFFTERLWTTASETVDIDALKNSLSSTLYLFCVYVFTKYSSIIYEYKRSIIVLSTLMHSGHKLLIQTVQRLLFRVFLIYLVFTKFKNFGFMKYSLIIY